MCKLRGTQNVKDNGFIFTNYRFGVAQRSHNRVGRFGANDAIRRYATLYDAIRR